MLRIAKYLHNKFWLLLAWLIILLATLLTLLRLLLPLLDLTDYRQEIERVVEQRVGMPLRIGSMHGEMLDARLAIRFQIISLLDPQTQAPRIHFREAHVQINLLRSLLNGELVLGKVLLVGGRLHLLRHPDGVFSVNGFRLVGGQNIFAGPLLSRLQLSVRDSEIHWQDQLTEAAPVHFHRVHASLINSGRRHRVAAVAQVGLLGAERLQLMADLWEGATDPLAVAGQVYLKSEGLELGGRLVSGLPAGVEVDQARVDLELWGEMQAGRLQRVQGKGELNDLLLSTEQAPALQLDHGAGLFDWRGDTNGWQLDLDRLVLMSNRRLWPPGRLSMAWRTSETGDKTLQVGVDYLRLKEVARFAALLPPVAEDIRQALAGLAPAGHLSRFRLALDQSPAQPTRWQVSGSVSDYSHQPWKSAPGLAGLNLSFTGNQDGGALQLGSKAFRAHIPRLFRDELSANLLRGHFDWHLDPQAGLHLKTDNLSIVTEDVQTFSRMELQLPWDGVQPFIDMQTDFWNGDGSRKSRYLPAGIMPKPLVDWLDRSLVSGHVKSGSMLLYGPLKAFPFMNHEGRFEVLFGIEDMVLDYKPGWPRLEQVVAEVHFLNNSLAIELQEGKILNSRLRQAKVNLPRLKGAAPVEIKGSVMGPFSDVFRFLNESPLQPRFEKFTRAVTVSGQALTGLDLQVPLKKTDAWRIQGEIDFQQAALGLNEQGLELQALAGRLQFDDKQVWGRDIEGRLLEQPVRLQVEPQQRDGVHMTHVETALTVPSSWLRQRFPGLLAALDGETPANIRLTIARGDSQTTVSLSVKSGLRGMAVKLPAPLGKARQSSRQLDLTLDFLSGQQRELRLAYGDSAQAVLRFEDGRIRQGEVRFGGDVAQLPMTESFRLRGNLQSLDLDSWFGWLNEQSQASATRVAMPVQVDLQVRELKLVGMLRPDVRLQIEPVAKGWQAGFNSDALNGTLLLPRERERMPLVGHFKQLRLKSAELAPVERPGEAQEPGAGRELDPRSLPGLELQVDSLWIDDQPHGKASLQWARTPQGIQVNDLSIRGRELNLSATGYWRKIGANHSTQLKVKAHVDSLGQFQQDLGLQLGITRGPLGCRR